MRLRTDELKTPRSPADWLSRQGLLPAGTKLSADELTRAQDVRDPVTHFFDL